jgi:hypothetical protein
MKPKTAFTTNQEILRKIEKLRINEKRGTFVDHLNKLGHKITGHPKNQQQRGENQMSREETQQARLVRSIATEVAYEIIEEHLDEYEHKPKKPDDFEAQLCEGSKE